MGKARSIWVEIRIGIFTAKITISLVSFVPGEIRVRAGHQTRAIRIGITAFLNDVKL